MSVGGFGLEINVFLSHPNLTNMEHWAKKSLNSAVLMKLLQ